MKTELKWRWSEWHEQNKKALSFILAFLKHPVSAIQNVPVFDWPTVIGVHVALTMAGGFLGGSLSGSWLGIFSGLFIFPLTSTLSLLILSGLFFYTFHIFFNRDLPFRKLFWVMAVAHIPFTITMIFAAWLPLAALLGTTASAALLIIGVTDNFALPKKTVITLVGILYAVYLALWIINSITMEESKKTFQQKATPESLDILEKELNDNQ